MIDLPGECRNEDGRWAFLHDHITQKGLTLRYHREGNTRMQSAIIYISIEGQLLRGTDTFTYVRGMPA